MSRSLGAFDYSRMGLSYSPFTLDTILCFCLICRRDAHTMAQYLQSTTHPNFVDMRRAYGTKINLGLCSYLLFVCTIGRRLLRRVLRIKNCQDPLIFAIFLVEPLVSASAGATTPLYGIARGLPGLNSRVCRGYDVDIHLLCSPYPRCVVALFLLLSGAI